MIEGHAHAWIEEGVTHVPQLRDTDVLMRGCLELVEAVEEGSESAEIATIEGDA